MTGLESILIGAAAKELAGPGRDLLTRIGQASYRKVANGLARTFSAHVSLTEERCTKIKNILYRDQSVFLLDQYVSVNFITRNHVKGKIVSVTDQRLLENLLGGGKFVVSGTAGAGKTMFMKWAALKSISCIKDTGVIPLFLELRYLVEEDSFKSFEEVLLERTSQKKLRISLEQFSEALSIGHFVIVLDAVDEINSKFRESIIAKIKDFIDMFPKCPIILSTRPNESLQAIGEVNVFHTTPMNKKQIIEVIEKLDYDIDVKKRLISRIKLELFETHNDFLSNPLLATIMLLTYDHAADIPTKMSSFYKLAFETLYQRHDAAKGIYKRDHYANLPLDEFKKFFSIFCFQTYVTSRYEFSEGELLTCFRDALEYGSFPSSPQDLIKDATETVCLLQKEGLDYIFVHRSFQEYFSALFISDYRGDDIREILNLVLNVGFDNPIVTMLIEINKNLLELEWIIPRLSSWLEDAKTIRLHTRAGLRKMISLTWPSIDLDYDTGDVNGVTLTEGSHGRWFLNLGKYYPEFEIRSLFSDNPVLGKKSIADLALDSEIAKLASFQAILEEIHLGPDEDDATPTVTISADDADWLIKTPLPHRLSEARRSVQKFYDELVQSHKTRQLTISALRKVSRLH